jgi:hypothetical protein
MCLSRRACAGCELSKHSSWNPQQSKFVNSRPPRPEWLLPETSNLISYLKLKEQRAKTNSRLLELKCSKCGQLFSSPTGLKTHLNSGGSICQRVIKPRHYRREEKSKTFIKQHDRDTMGQQRRSISSPCTRGPSTSSSLS